MRFPAMRCASSLGMAAPKAMQKAPMARLSSSVVGSLFSAGINYLRVCFGVVRGAIQTWRYTFINVGGV